MARLSLKPSRLALRVRALSQPARTTPIRVFSSKPAFRTDGVYRELTAMRIQTPYIEALRKRQEGKDEKPISTESVSRDLTPKSMKDSYHRVILPLARDPYLLDSYINGSGHIRLGTLFMDLDALAGVVSYKHTGAAVMTVTAAVDRITIKRPLSTICDLELSGQVTFATGRSSMEVSLQVAKAPEEGEEGEEVKEEDILVTCAFTMVSLDPATKKPVAIAPLKAETEEEKRLFNQGQENYNMKKNLAKTALLKQTPNDEESDLIHALWLRQLDYHDPNTPARKPTNALYMKSTSIQSVQIMQPQYRNRHNFMIFGGFLLKTTFELAFTCASAISHSRPTFIALDPSTFENPVPVGSVLYLTATVAYTDSPLIEGQGDVKSSPEGRTRIQVRVDSKIRNIEHAETKPTGMFNYTFEVDGDLKIVPETYSQFMVYLDARRRAHHVALLEHHDVTGGVTETQAKESVME
ncbi:acyl-coenzyme A thioesterase 9 [Xylogone sp. PMI_703]|nr:acyl-coenzyme A thioesterase 9 [Xylogone sp. PMI_703]